MKTSIYAIDGKKGSTIALPVQFAEEVRPDLIRRAVVSMQANARQPYGAFPKAGQRPSAVLSRRRRKYKTSYGHGISRVPRKALWKRGRQFGWVGAFAPGMVKGRRAHPPKAQKIFAKSINEGERRKAIRSALAASVNIEWVKNRGHKVSELPSVVEKKMEKITKTSEVYEVLQRLQLGQELDRVAGRKVRAGKGKLRGRRYKTKKGPLIVVAGACALLKAAHNIPGVDVCAVHQVNAERLAPGGNPGRLTIYSEDAIARLEKEQLFMHKKNRRGKLEQRKDKGETKE